MSRFHSQREAKEFLVAKIAEEAQREGVSLSEVERKMLYFSETDWTLTDMMDVNDEFDREYDQDEYEKKIRGLVGHLTRRIKREDREEYDSFVDAVRTLSKGDHYVLVMIGRVRPPGDLLELLVTALAISAGLFGGVFLAAKYNIQLERFVPSQETVARIVWTGLASIAIAYSLSWLMIGREKTELLLSKTIEKLLGLGLRKK